MSDLELFVGVAFGLGIFTGVLICDLAMKFRRWRMSRRLTRYRRLLNGRGYGR